MPGNTSHTQSYDSGKKWFEFNGQIRCPACRLKGTRFSLLHFTSPCTTKTNFEPRAHSRESETLPPHPSLLRNIENGCGMKSGGKADNAYPPVIGMISEEGCQRIWLNIKIGEHLLISIMGERVVFRTTHCRFTPESGIFPVSLVIPRIGPFRAHHYVDSCGFELDGIRCDAWERNSLPGFHRVHGLEMTSHV